MYLNVIVIEKLSYTFSSNAFIILPILLLISWLDTIWLWFIVSSLLMFLSLTRMPPTCKPEDPVITINIFSYRQKEAPDPIALADPMR